MLYWLMEIAGVLLLASAAGLWSPPLGLAVVGLYLMVTANMGGE